MNPILSSLDDLYVILSKYEVYLAHLLYHILIKNTILISSFYFYLHYVKSNKLN